MYKKPKSEFAIPTEFGWADSRNGELLVSMRGLPNPVPGFKIGNPHTIVTQEEKKDNHIPEEFREIEEVQQTVKTRTFQAKNAKKGKS